MARQKIGRRRPVLNPGVEVVAAVMLLVVGVAAAQTSDGKARVAGTDTAKQLPPSVFQVAPDQWTEVPNLKGRRLEEIPSILEKARLKLGDKAYANSDEPKGVVIGQKPGAGQRVLRGTSVAVLVSSGSVMVTVPDVTGSPLSVARAILTKVGLNVGDIRKSESKSPPDTVLDQFPRAGSMAKPGSSVNLTIAVPMWTEVPNLKGRRREEVPSILKEAGLIPGDVVYVNSDDPKGVVTAQKPGVGQRVPYGTPVAVTVSRGSDMVAVPDVTGRPLSAARRFLARVGLNVGDIRKAESKGPVDTVLDQFPRAGSMARPGSSVSLTIAVPIAEVSVPRLIGMTEKAARQRLTDADLAQGRRQKRNADEPAGTIIDQAPAAGSLVPRGTAVNSVVSTGPRSAIVPDLLGQSVSEAENRLRKAGLLLGHQEEQQSDEPQGRILRQNPAQGTRASLGVAVDVTISTSLTTVPDLGGLGSDEARRRLEQGGLVLGPVQDEVSDRSAGTVLRQDPSAGTRVQRGTPVKVWMAVPNKFPLGTIATILAATVLVAEGYRRLAKRGKRRRDDRDKGSGLEIRAVPDEGKQRVSRRPANAAAIGFVVHPDDNGRQSIRFQGQDRGREEGEHE